MNSPNPFVPQGSLLEQQSKRRSRLKFTVYCVLAVGITSLTAMLIQGCKREQTQVENQPQPPLPPIETNVAAMDTNLPPPMEASNPPVPPPPVAPQPVVTTPPIAPSVTPSAAPAPSAPSESQYVVIKGDSLWKIAHKNGVTLKALEAANPGINPARLQIGQKLTIPAPSSPAQPATAGAAGESGAAPGQPIYIVKSGDTLSRIARHFGTTVKAIESENNLLTTRIKVGQKLKIPVKAETAVPETAPSATGTLPPPDNTSNPQ